MTKNNDYIFPRGDVIIGFTSDDITIIELNWIELNGLTPLLDACAAREGLGFDHGLRVGRGRREGLRVGGTLPEILHVFVRRQLRVRAHDEGQCTGVQGGIQLIEPETETRVAKLNKVKE